MRRNIKILLVLLIVIWLTGCWDQQVFERLGFILTTGIDYGEDNNVKVTYTIPVIQQKSGKSNGGDSTSNFSLEVIETKLLREARDILRMRSPNILEGGKIQSILVGREMAQKEITKYLEVFERDITNPVQSWVIVVDGQAYDLIKGSKEFEDKPRLSFYLNNLINIGISQGFCPHQTVIEYDILQFSPGIDPVVPLIKLGDKEIIVLGSALIDGDHMTGQLDTQETVYLSMAMGEKRKSELFIPVKDESQGNKGEAAINLRNLKRKLKVDIIDGKPQVKISLQLKIILDEISWNKLEDPKIEKELEGIFTEKIKASLDSMLVKLREANCDALGIGQIIRGDHYDFWKEIGEEKGWKKIYPYLAINTDVKADIIRYGAIE